MRYTAATNIELEFVALLDAAQSEPVIIERGRQEVAVLLSARDYDRLRGAANLDFQDFCDSVADNAGTRGLTESKLADLLNHV